MPKVTEHQKESKTMNPDEATTIDLWDRISTYVPDKVIDGLHFESCLIEDAWSSSLESRIELHLVMIRHAIERAVSIKYDQFLMEDLARL